MIALQDVPRCGAGEEESLGCRPSCYVSVWVGGSATMADRTAELMGEAQPAAAMVPLRAAG
jgi:hypothetical protein